jgi:hypothetical protein
MTWPLIVAILASLASALRLEASGTRGPGGTRSWKVIIG